VNEEKKSKLTGIAFDFQLQENGTCLAKVTRTPPGDIGEEVHIFPSMHQALVHLTRYLLGNMNIGLMVAAEMLDEMLGIPEEGQPKPEPLHGHGPGYD
jgi:hypothetical protein